MSWPFQPLLPSAPLLSRVSANPLPSFVRAIADETHVQFTADVAVTVQDNAAHVQLTDPHG